MTFIKGTVTTPLGFVANSVHCGIRKNKTKHDLALVYCEKPCTAAAMHTSNLVKGAPNRVTAANLENGIALEKKYKECGIENLLYIDKKVGVDHHPHGPSDIDFAIKYLEN